MKYQTKQFTTFEQICCDEGAETPFIVCNINKNYTQDFLDLPVAVASGIRYVSR